jgi:hypothetical protein
MATILAFTPFIVFALVDRLVGGLAGLVSAALAAAAMLAYGMLVKRRSPKVLDVGTFLVFGGLALYAIATQAEWSVFGVRLRVDAGLLLIILVSMAIREPFTLQYAREKVAPEKWGEPAFIRSNYVITAVWALAFAIMVAADAIAVAMPDVPTRVPVIMTVTAMVGAVHFTSWYPRHLRAKAGA